MCKAKLPDIDARHANQQPDVRFTQNFLSVTTYGENDGNYLSCPIGVLLLLTTLLGSGGARGQTATQIGNTLKLTNTVKSNDIRSLQKSAKEMHGKLYNSLSKEDFIVEERRVPVVTITNGVFLQKSYEFRSEFKKSLKADFSGRKEKINFTDSYEAMQKINWWIKEKTNDLIPNFITSKNELPKDTKIILANILTFKAAWQETFSALSTQKQDFWITKRTSVKVPMMYAAQPLGYATFPHEGFSLLEKPMRGNRFSMVILLPQQKWDLRGVEKVLNGFYLLKDLVAKAQVTGVALRLPRFKIESQINLIPYMQTLGIQDLFTRGLADLSGITDSDKLLFVNLMKQSSVLKVNEEGVEAAAVTGMAVVPLSLTVPKVEFHVNHPFVCFIYDRELRLPLFAARVTNPQQP